ncbi:MAG: hypothetical protein J6W41_00840 [Alphaproteobacteria bacterium]|nr:hypothetical protein [Alphaproteobacteria bacterium]
MIKDKKYKFDADGHMDCPNIERRIGIFLSGMAYSAWLDFGIELYESDIQWIENNITKNSTNNIRDIFWRLDSWERGKNISPYHLDYTATFFEQFIDMPGIPRNVNRLFIYAVGVNRFYYNIKIAPTPYQHFFIERWMETCR